MGVTTEPPWVHKSAGIAPRNGTNTHVINFTTDGDAPFTPANGNELVLVIFGGVTNANAGGWNERMQPVSSGELSLFTFTASSTTSVTITHNASNYPCPWFVCELPAGSIYTSGTSDNASSDTFSALGLPGTEQLVFAAKGRVAGGSETNGSSTWAGPWVEDADLFIASGATDGAYLTVGHQINVTAASITAAPSTTYSGTWGVGDREKMTWAYNAVAPSSLTPFTKDYGLQWRVLNTFTKDYAAQWRVLGGFTKDYAVNWRVLNSLTKDYVVNWRVLNTIAKDYVVNWRVLNSVTKDYALAWRVLGTFTKDVTLNWRVLNSISKDYVLVWNVYAGFAKDYALVWDVFSSTGFAKDYGLQWRVLGGFDKDYALQWRVLNTLQVDYDLRWRVLNALVKDYDLAWNVLADTQFVKSYTVLWNVRELFEKDYALRWRVLSDLPPAPLPADVVAALEEYTVAYLTAETVVAYIKSQPL